MGTSASPWRAGGSRTGAWYALGFTVWTVSAQWAFGATGQWQFDRVAFEGGAWWQLATSQWVHLSWSHAAMNAAAAALVLVALADWVDLPTQGMALLGGYAGVALVVAMDPACTYYAGASGALHGLLAGSAVNLALTKGLGPNAADVRRNSRSRILGWSVLVGVGAKLLIQHFAGASSGPGWLGLVAYQPAHVSGTFAGATVVALGSVVRQYALSQHQRH
jgi:rhomboid family GlyGly-CTERM serine protease